MDDKSTDDKYSFDAVFDDNPKEDAKSSLIRVFYIWRVRESYDVI